MKKVFLILVGLVILAGCTYQGKPLADYLDDPKTILEDPHYAQYMEQRDKLERAYLDRKIPYDEYLKARDALDQQYTREVKKRNDVITSEY